MKSIKINSTSRPNQFWIKTKSSKVLKIWTKQEQSTLQKKQKKNHQNKNKKKIQLTWALNLSRAFSLIAVDGNEGGAGNGWL